VARRPLLLLALLLPAPVATAEEVEEVEVIEAIEEVTPVATTGPSPTRAAGRLHPAASHLPLGGLVAVLLLELLALARPRLRGGRFDLLLLALALAGALPTVTTGLLRASELSAAGGGSPALPTHRNLMLGALALAAAALAVRWRLPDPPAGALPWAYRALLLAAVGVATVGGHLGGLLAHGDPFRPY